MTDIDNGERILPHKISSDYEYLWFLRHLFAYQYTLNNLLKKTDRVLEIGFGDGYGANLLAQGAAQLIAIDNNEKTVSHAKNKYKRENLEFLLNKTILLPFPDAYFDKVVSFHVIEHIQEDTTVVAEVYRVLKNGGKFIVSTPNKIYRVKEGYKPWYKFHVREYTPNEFKNLLCTSFNAISLKFVSVPLSFFDMEIKFSRIATIIHKYDFLSLNQFVPYKLKQIAYRLLSIIDRPKSKKISLKDFSMLDTDIRGLDLFAICEKKLK